MLTNFVDEDLLQYIKRINEQLGITDEKLKEFLERVNISDEIIEIINLLQLLEFGYINGENAGEEDSAYISIDDQVTY